MIDSLKTDGEWKIHLTRTINFFFLKISRKCTMHTKSDNIEVLISYETDKIIEELFGSLLKRYQKGLEEKSKELSLILIVFTYYIINVIK